MRACLCGSLGWLLVSSVLANAADGGDRPAEWLRWHFLGTTRIAADTNGARAQAVFQQPTTRQLANRALDGLARSAAKEAAEAGAVRQLFDDVLRVESHGALRGEPGQADEEWTLAMRLGEEGAGEWTEKWEEVRQAAGFGYGAGRVTHEWFVGGLGRGAAPDLEPLRERVLAAPSADEEVPWLELEVDLARLAVIFDWPDSVAWPRAQARLAGRGPNVRTTGGFTYPAPLELPLGDWQVPTNTIREPLRSFAALQGIQPWLAAQSSLKELEWPVPQQVFVWSQSLSPYTTHAAWPMSNAPVRIPAAQGKLKSVVRGLLPWLDLGEVEQVPEMSRLSWRGLPILVPFLTPAEDAGFAWAGLFPVANPTEPAPAELYEQLWGRTNLVYYHWELTQPRLEDWEALDMVHAMIGGYMPPPSNSVARAWLHDTNVTSHLGNCVTELKATSAQELEVVRNSAVGLTAFELFRAALWIEGDRFPRHTPPQPVDFRRLMAPSTNGPAVKP